MARGSVRHSFMILVFIGIFTFTILFGFPFLKKKYGVPEDVLERIKQASIEIKQKQNEQREESQEDLIAQLAAIIVEQNKSMIGEDVAEVATKKIQEENIARKKRGRPRKNTQAEEMIQEGGTKENEQEERQTKGNRTTKTA